MQEPSSGEQGRIGIQVETTSFAVTPGDRVIIPIVLSNHGLEGDVLTLAVDGIPSSWIYASAASTALDPGQAQEVSLTIQPPHSLQASAGRHPFRIQVTSQSAPGQVFEVACVLTIAAFAEFSSELRPQRVEAGEPARVTVENRGNFQQAYTLTSQSPDDALLFEPGPSQELRVPPGEVAFAEFRATPRNRPFFGGEVTFPFTARVQSADLAVQNHNGEVVSRALIPAWLLAAVLILIVAIACLSVALILWGGAPEGAPTEPAAVQPTDEVAQPAPTEPAPEPTPTRRPGASSTPDSGQPAPTEPPPEQPTEPPPEQPTEPPPPEQPTEPPSEQPTEPPPEQPTEPPPEQPTEPPPEQPTEPPPEQSTEPPPEQPTEPGQPCTPLAFGLILAPLLVAFKKRKP
jgi:hypothetical protein